MNNPQQDAIEMLEGQGYVLIRESVWPEYRHPDTGSHVQVDFSGRVIPKGWEKKDG
jgi:hypothetical protein